MQTKLSLRLFLIAKYFALTVHGNFRPARNIGYSENFVFCQNPFASWYLQERHFCTLGAAHSNNEPSIHLSNHVHLAIHAYICRITYIYRITYIWRFTHTFVESRTFGDSRMHLSNHVHLAIHAYICRITYIWRFMHAFTESCTFSESCTFGKSSIHLPIHLYLAVHEDVMRFIRTFIESFSAFRNACLFNHACILQIGSPIFNSRRLISNHLAIL